MAKFKKYTKLIDDKVADGTAWFDPEYKKAWEELDPNVKESISQYLTMSIQKMENRIALETMACVIEDLIKRVKKLEECKDVLDQR